MLEHWWVPVTEYSGFSPHLHQRGSTIARGLDLAEKVVGEGFARFGSRGGPGGSAAGLPEVTSLEA
jgi:hypothetical protein